MMRRDECFEKIAERRGEAIVVATYSSAFEWRRIAPNALNYVGVGAMGQASSHALGLALGLPGHKVIVLDGDGSLLMNLGSLVTIAGAAPANLVHFVAENGCYEANGSHPIPALGRVDFAGLARAAGYAEVFEFDALDRFAAELPLVLSAPGPVFAALKIEPGETPELDYEWMHGDRVRRDFKDAIRPLIAAARRAARSFTHKRLAFGQPVEAPITVRQLPEALIDDRGSWSNGLSPMRGSSIDDMDCDFYLINAILIPKHRVARIFNPIYNPYRYAGFDKIFLQNGRMLLTGSNKFDPTSVGDGGCLFIRMNMSRPLRRTS